jgi:hypothetical protein
MGDRRGRVSTYTNGKDAPLKPGDELGAYTPERLLEMDQRFCARLELAFAVGLERRSSAQTSVDVTPPRAATPALKTRAIICRYRFLVSHDPWFQRPTVSRGRFAHTAS